MLASNLTCEGKIVLYLYPKNLEFRNLMGIQIRTPSYQYQNGAGGRYALENVGK